MVEDVGEVRRRTVALPGCRRGGAGKHTRAHRRPVRRPERSGLATPARHGRRGATRGWQTRPSAPPKSVTVLCRSTPGTGASGPERGRRATTVARDPSAGQVPWGSTDRGGVIPPSLWARGHSGLLRFEAPGRSAKRYHLPLRPCPVRLNGCVAYIARITERRSATRPAVRASAAAAPASPIGVERTRATAGVPRNRLVDQDLPDLGVRTSRRRARRRATTGQGANRAGRPRQTDAVRYLFVLRGNAKPSRVALAELRNECPHLRRFRRSRERGALVLQGILLGRTVVPLNLHVSVAEGGSWQCQY